MATVVLVPGFGSYKDIEWNYSPYTKWYNQEGFDVVKYRQKNYGTNCIKENSESLGRLIEKVNDSYVVLVGHSMGGIVACLAAEQIDVKKVITLASPLKGTPWATLWPICKAIKQMQPGSKLLDHIKFLSFANPETLMTVSCRFDGLVPAQNAELNSAKRLRVNHTHTSLVFSKNVHSRTIDFIRS